MSDLCIECGKIVPGNSMQFRAMYVTDGNTESVIQVSHRKSTLMQLNNAPSFVRDPHNDLQLQSKILNASDSSENVQLGNFNLDLNIGITDSNHMSIHTETSSFSYDRELGQTSITETPAPPAANGHLNITFIIDSNTDSDVMDESTPIDMRDTSLKAPESTTRDVSEHVLQDSSIHDFSIDFDVTRAQHADVTVIHERTIDDEVSYKVVELGRNQEGKKLVSSDGCSFCVKVKQMGKDDVIRSASRLVEDRLPQTFGGLDFNLPNNATLARLVNRAGAKDRPKEPRPTEIDFEVNRDLIGDPEFLDGDLHVNCACHLMIATERQLQLKKYCRRWFMDGTFKIVNEPFSQLFSIHGFVRSSDYIKQVPFLFVLMTRRRTEDYKAVLQRVVDLLI